MMLPFKIQYFNVFFSYVFSVSNKKNNQRSSEWWDPCLPSPSENIFFTIYYYFNVIAVNILSVISRNYCSPLRQFKNLNHENIKKRKF